MEMSTTTTTQDTEKPGVYRLLAIAGFQAYNNSLVGNPAPSVRAYFHRAHNPEVGDLVVETSTIWMKKWNPAALGWLLEDTREPVQTDEEHDAMLAEGDYWKESAEGHDAIPTERIFYIDVLDPEVPSPFRWHNASFIMIPANL